MTIASVDVQLIFFDIELVSCLLNGLEAREGHPIRTGTQILELGELVLAGVTYPTFHNVTSLPFIIQVPIIFFPVDTMPSQITTDIFHDPAISKTVKELHGLISRRYLPNLGPQKLQDTE